MADADLEKMSEWLGITKQQLMIITVINKLGAQGVPASPKSICDEFKNYENKLIHKSNLFTQIKALADKGFIAKAGKADYVVVPEAMKSDLMHRRGELLDEAAQMDDMASSLNRYLDAPQDKAEQSIEYLDHKDLFDVLEKKLRYAKECCMVSRFPSITFTYPASNVLKRSQYLKTLQDRCFGARDIKLNVITHLDVSHPFDCSLAFYKDTEAAYREADLIIRQLENQAKAYDNLDVRYTEQPFGFDVLIPIIDDINEFFMFVRSEKDPIVSGIHIRSTKTAKKAYDRFMRECQGARRMQGKYAEDVCSKLQSRLKELYENFPKEKVKAMQRGAENLEADPLA